MHASVLLLNWKQAPGAAFLSPEGGAPVPHSCLCRSGADALTQKGALLHLKAAWKLLMVGESISALARLANEAQATDCAPL